jgi:hypothetical protein
MAEQTATEIDLVDLVGVVAAGEYEAAKDIYKPRLLLWTQKLSTLDDVEFARETSRAIYESATVARFGSGWDHEHFKASACFHEAERRHVAAGHDEDCRGETIYSREHARLMREHGYAPTEPGQCRCEGLTGG